MMEVEMGLTILSLMVPYIYLLSTCLKLPEKMLSGMEKPIQYMSILFQMIEYQ